MRHDYKNSRKILLICLLNILLVSNNVFAQTNVDKASTLSPSISISNQNLKAIIQNIIQPKQSSSFITRRPKDWPIKRRPRQWPKRSYSTPPFKLDALTEKLMVYPTEMLNRPDLFDHVDVTEPGIAYDMEHFEFNYETGYWHSRDFSNLVLGTWEDVEKKFPSNSAYSNTRAKMKRHVVSRYKNPNTNKTISFYFFDNHAYSVPYALEAKQRNELPKKIDHIFVDQHSDALKAFGFEFPKILTQWNQLVKDDFISMNSFHSVFGRLNMFSRLIWTFDGDAKNYTSRAKAVSDLKVHSGCKTVKGICMSEYANLSSRPKNNLIFLNIDVDTTDQMLEMEDDPMLTGYPRIALPEQALKFYTDFLLQLIQEDNVDIASFQASTTSWFRRDDGDVETTRYLARVAPAIILNSSLDKATLKSFTKKTARQHKDKLTIGKRLKNKLEALSQSNKKNNLKLNQLNTLVNQSI